MRCSMAQHSSARRSLAWHGAAELSTTHHAWHDVAQHGAAQHSMHGTMRRSTARHSSAQHSTHGTARHSAARRGTAQHSTHGTAARTITAHAITSLAVGAGRAAACSKEGKRAGCVGRGAAGCRPGCMLLRDSRAMPSCAELCCRVLGRAAPRRAVRAALGSVPACVRWGGQPALIKAAIRR